MKRWVKNSILFKRCIVIVALASGLLLAKSQSELTILHTSDTHSQIDAYVSSSLGEVGGILSRYEFITQERKLSKNVLLFDSGDFTVGTPYYNFFGGEIEIQLMNKLGYDVATLGNHEFDNGCDALAKILRQANFSIVCANYTILNRKLIKLIKPYVVLEIDTLRIGVFGLCPDLKYLSGSKETREQVIFNDPIATAQKMVSLLTSEEQCDFIICLSHLGYTSHNKDDITDIILAENITGIDLILGGHSHTLLEQPEVVNHIPIVHSGSKGAFVSKILIHLNDLNN